MASASRSRFRNLFALWMLLMSAAVASGGTGRARHQRLFVVPRPGPVVIDGKLDDWDFSAHIFSYVVKDTADQRHARFAMMYDGEALYIGAKVLDDSPMMNRHDPQANAVSGWDADACQVRMVLDPAQGYPVNDSSKINPRPNDQLVHMLFWHYTDRQEANLQLMYGMTYGAPQAGYKNNVVPHDKFQGAYRKWDDGRGYDFEYRIPWATLEARNPPKAGDLVAGAMQILWSTPDGMHVVKQSGVIYDVLHQGAGFPWQNAGCWGKFIFSPQGNLPRELTEPETDTAEAEPPLSFSFQMPEAGEASLALLDDQGLVVRQLLAQAPRTKGKVVEKWDGLDDQGKPLPAGSYRMRGVYHQGISTRYVMSIHNSGEPAYKNDAGTGGWGADHGSPTAACAVEGGMLLGWDHCEVGWGLIRTDLDGRKQWSSTFSAIHLATAGKVAYSAGADSFRRHRSVRIFDPADGRSLSFGSGRPFADQPEDFSGKEAVSGLAWRDGKLYIAYAERDLIVVNDALQGNVLAAWTVPAPKGLAFTADGTLLVAGATAVLAVRDGKSSPFIEREIDQPQGVAVDRNGLIYVANHGRRQDVSVFDAKGSFLRGIGKPGGRPAIGLYDAAGMFRPAGIAIDGNNRLWVPEEADGPKRISVWEPESGKLWKEFFGGSAYSTFVWIDPRRPDEAYCHNTIWKIDLDKGTWYPHSTIWRHQGGDGIRETASSGYVGRFRVVTAKNGRQFGWGGVTYGNVMFMRDGDIFKPITGVINVVRSDRFIDRIPPVLVPEKKRFPDGYYHWQDANGDQAVQPDEMHPRQTIGGTRSFNWIDADLNVWCDSGEIFRPVRFEGDRPIYDFDKPEPATFIMGANSGFTSTWIDNDRPDGVYRLNPGRPVGFGKWSFDGKMLWGYRGVVHWQNSVNLPPLQPGKLWGPTMPLGVAGDFTGMATYFGPFHLFTRDGDYVAMIFRDLRLGGLHPDTLTAEAFAGQLVKPDGMNRYFILTGDQDGRVTEVLGLDKVKPLSAGKLAISGEDVRKVQEAQTALAAARAGSQTLVVARGRASLPTAQRVGKTVGDRGFSAAVARDTENLFVHYKITTPNPLENSIREPRLLFKGGNLLDVQIAADLNADPKRKAAVPGDQRLLVSGRDGKTVATLYRPKIAGFTGEPIVLSSPTGSEAFDAIEDVSGRVTLEHKTQADGFTATLVIPLELLGLKLEAGSVLRLDLGYIFGNPTGSMAALRAYWSNNSFTANIINDVPNESRLEPGQWGTAAVE